jgi:hypothetical protein
MPILLWLMLVATPPAEQAAQAAPPAIQATTPTPLSTDRIERALAHEPVLKPAQDDRIFRVEVFGKKPTIFDFIGTDVLRGPVPIGSSAHQEFLKMVTPEDVQGYAMFSNKEGAVVAATSLANGLILKALLESFYKVRGILRTRAEQNARSEVLSALAELQRARALAGLPPK